MSISYYYYHLTLKAVIKSGLFKVVPDIVLYCILGKQTHGEEVDDDRTKKKQPMIDDAILARCKVADDRRCDFDAV